MDSLIFSLTDVREIRKVSINIDDFDMYAREAQITFLEKVLGAKLYTAFLANIGDARFVDLLDGTVYTDGVDVNFRGVKPYLCYVWLYLYSLDSAVAVTPIGSRIFKDDNAQYTEQMTALKQAQTNYLTASESYERAILAFLNANTDVYPEFSESEQLKVAKESNNTFKIFGKSYNPPNKIW